MTKLGQYINGNYSVEIYSDGTKVRETLNPNDNEFASEFPESIDLKITDKCSNGCPFCYEGSSIRGKHSDIMSYRFIDTLHPFTEIAINGNDMDHPDLEKFLLKIKENNVIANLTVHQNQLEKNIKFIRNLKERELLYGIGVSVSDANESLKENISGIDNVVMHTVCGITTPETYIKLSNMHAKVLILGYKNTGFGFEYAALNKMIVNLRKKWLKDNVLKMMEKCSILSFDNLAIDQLDIKSMVDDDDWNEFYMGDDGDFTFYIDAVKGTFSKNSISTDDERYNVGDMSVDDMFIKLKSTITK